MSDPMTTTDQTPQPPARPEPRLSGPDICQVPGEDGSAVCVRTIAQRPCRTCPAYPEPPAAPAQPSATPPAAAGPHPDTPQPGGLDLDAIEARCDAATPGPWHATGRDDDPGDEGWRVNGGGVPGSASERAVAACPTYSRHAAQDMAFIAHSRTDVPALVAEVDRLRELTAPQPGGDGHGVLGRALLDGENGLWYDRGSGRVYYGAHSSTEDYVRRNYGPVREVLLVSPAAGRVLEAAGYWRRLTPVPTAPEEEALADAVDALDGDHPAEPATERCCTQRDGYEYSGPGWIDRRAWTHQQWLDDARAIFYSVHGGAADLLNGHIMALFGELHAVTEQRDLAIAHDRQPYPTAHAYEKVCATLERKRAELAEVTADRDRLSELLAERGALDQIGDELRDQLRRDGAADALADGAGRVRRVFTDTTGPRVAQYLDAVARGYRAGTRPVTASPEPAGGGDDAD